MILLTIENLKPHPVFKNEEEFLSIINNLSNNKELYLKCLENKYFNNKLAKKLHIIQNIIFFWRH